MDIGALLSRAFDTLWKHKFLILLGVLLALCSGEGSARFASTRLLRYLPVEPGSLIARVPGLEALPASLLPETDPAALSRFVARLGPRGLVILFSLSLLLIALGVLGLTLRGSLIAGVDRLETGREASVGRAWRDGWRQAWRLIVIASIPPIPITLAAILIVAGLTIFIHATGGVERLGETLSAPLIVPALAMASLTVTALLGLATLALLLLWPLAERACLMEDRRPVESYRRGWQVLRANPGSWLLLFLVQWGVRAAFSSLLLIPGLLVTLCFAFIPLVWLIGGTGKAFSSALWTLAWGQWTAGEPGSSPAPEEPPAA